MLSLIVLSQFLPQTAQAIVSMDQAITDSKKEGFSQSIHLTLDGAAGNTEKNSVQADMLGQWRHDDSTEFLLLQHAYGKSGGVVNTDRTFLHLRHRTRLNDIWAGEIFTQTGQDAFTRLRNRSLLGAGVRYSVIEVETETAVYMGIGAFYERELLQETAATTDVDSRLWRGNFYLILKKEVNAQLSLSSTTYLQPALGNRHDYRLLEEASALVGLFENVGLRLSIDYSFDSMPAQTVKGNDFRYSTGFDIYF